jgi:hypothetical protein
VLPTNVVPGLGSVYALNSQKTEKLKKWQPKDGEIISFDIFEQLYPSALDPIRADASENVSFLGGNIVIEEGVREMPHSQPRPAHSMP